MKSRSLYKTDFGTYAFEFNYTETTGFLTSENTIGQYDPRYPETEDIPMEYGFKIIDTGGGRTAWHQVFNLDGKVVHMLVTDTGGSTHQIYPEDLILVGVYKGTDIGKDPVAIWEQTNFPLSLENENLPSVKSLTK